MEERETHLKMNLTSFLKLSLFRTGHYLITDQSIFILVYIFRTDVIPRGEALEKKRTRFF